MQNIRTLALSQETWLLVAISGVCSAFFLWTTIPGFRPGCHPPPPPAALKAGAPVDVAITLVGSDSTGLACGSEQVVDGARCAFTLDGDNAAVSVAPGTPSLPT